jgi:hypothetical protein
MYVRRPCALVLGMCVPLAVFIDVYALAYACMRLLHVCMHVMYVCVCVCLFVRMHACIDVSHIHVLCVGMYVGVFCIT